MCSKTCQNYVYKISRQNILSRMSYVRYKHVSASVSKLKILLWHYDLEVEPIQYFVM